MRSACARSATSTVSTIFSTNWPVVIPSLILDNCAAGGRRLDFEMMRRCIVLWRSDNTWGHETFPQNVQAMTHGLSLWLPLHGLGAAATDDLALRSGMGACGGFSINYRNPKAVAALRKHLDSYLKVRPIYTGDFYPLTPHTLDNNTVDRVAVPRPR